MTSPIVLAVGFFLFLQLPGFPSAYGADATPVGNTPLAEDPGFVAPTTATPSASGAAEEPKLKYVNAMEGEQARMRIHSYGLAAGWSPVYKPKVSDQLPSTLSSDLEAALIFPGAFELGIRYGTGTVNSLHLPDGTTAGNVSHTLYEVFFEGDIPLNQPYAMLGPVELVIPLFVAGFNNQLDAGGTKYGNVGIDLATGLGARVFTTTFVVAEAAGLYHLGLPLWDVRHDSLQGSVLDPGGGTVSGSTSGFELRFRLLFFFSPPF